MIIGIDPGKKGAVAFECFGIPRPGGSKRGFVHRSTGRVIMVDMGKDVKSWRAEVAHEGALAMRGRSPLTGPLSLTVTFSMPRPKYHFDKGGTLSKRAPTWHTKAPDTTKLLRSTEDALKGICWVDDAQVVVQVARKIFSNGTPGASIVIEALESDAALTLPSPVAV